MPRAHAEMASALALEPLNEEAAELVWRIIRLQHAARREPEPDAGREARLGMLLAKAAPGQPDDEARHAVLELSLLAPDDRRVTEVVRERFGRGKASGSGGPRQE
jgi:hypothetical protein